MGKISVYTNLISQRERKNIQGGPKK